MRVVFAQHALRVQAAQAPVEAGWRRNQAEQAGTSGELARVASWQAGSAAAEPLQRYSVRGSRVPRGAQHRRLGHTAASVEHPGYSSAHSQAVMAEDQLQVPLLQGHTGVVWRRQAGQAVHGRLLHHSRPHRGVQPRCKGLRKLQHARASVLLRDGGRARGRGLA